MPTSPAVLPAAYIDESVTLFHGDCIRVLRALTAESVDSVVCDPPYAIAAIGDYLAPHRVDVDNPMVDCSRCGTGRPEPELDICNACRREMEVDAFYAAGMLGQQSANWHEKATHSRGYADNNHLDFARWVTLWSRECLRVLKPGGHIVAFGGTKTWHRLATAIEDAGFEIRDSLAWLYATGFPKSLDVARAVEKHLAKNATREHTSVDASSGSTVTAERWEGWGTALKPAHEPIVLARKPLRGTVASNTLAYGTGGLNIDGARLQGERWPTNVLLDQSQSQELDEVAGREVSRFFWVAKPGRSERVCVDGVAHPTVKPLDLMRELVRLVTPAGGTVLDPFAGSGTTFEACVLEGLKCIGVERDATFVPLIRARMDRCSAGGVHSQPTDDDIRVDPLALF